MADAGSPSSPPASGEAVEPQLSVAPGPGSYDFDDEPIKIHLKFSPEKFSETCSFPAGATLLEFIFRVDDMWPQFDWNHCKMMVETRPRRPGVKPLLKLADDSELELSLLHGTTIKLLAQRVSDIEDLHAASAAASARQAQRAAFLRQSRTRARARHDQRTAQEDAQYTFHTVRPLQHLPRPERSLALLERLKADPGIRAAMRRHKFSVALLTEMDPAEHTEHGRDGATTRVLGLNRNKGEVVELRLRTDARDGYRAYRSVRDTLCHELAHNVHGPHDADFWALCRTIEREVAAADWKSGGRAVGEEEFAPARGEEEGGEEVMDHGGWTGGEFVLGGGNRNVAAEPLSRREILARAAEERIRSLEKASRSGGQGGGGSAGEGASS
jgi:hypothetical protein